MEPRPEGVSRQRGTSGRWLQPPARLPLGRIRPRWPESAHDRYRPVEGLPIRQHRSRRPFPRQRTVRTENQSSPLTRLVHKKRKSSDCPSLSTVGRLWHFYGFGVRNPTQAYGTTLVPAPRQGVDRALDTDFTAEAGRVAGSYPAAPLGTALQHRFRDRRQYSQPLPPWQPLFPIGPEEPGSFRALTPPDRLEAPRLGRRPRCGRPVRPRSSLPAAPTAGPRRRSPSPAARRARRREHHRRDPSPQQRLERHHHADGRPVSTRPHRLPQAAASVPPLWYCPRPPRRGQSASPISARSMDITSGTARDHAGVSPRDPG